MWNMIKQVIRFRMSQKATRGIARSVGLGKVAGIIGLIGGYRALRSHRRA